jgi:hypothetical protein
MCLTLRSSDASLPTKMMNQRTTGGIPLKLATLVTALAIVASVYFGLYAAKIDPVQWLIGKVTKGEIVATASPGNILSVHRGETVLEKFALSNHSRGTVRILGATAGCGCVVVGGIPVAIPAGGTAEVQLKIIVGAPDPSGKFAKSIALFCDTKISAPDIVVSLNVI